MNGQRVHVDPDIGIPDLVRSLSADSRRLLDDELRLAKLEMRDSAKKAGKGALWMGLAFGIGIVTMVAFTVFVAAMIGRVANGNYWLGAIVTGLLELGLAVFLFKKGIEAYAKPSYTLEVTRESLKDTANWVSHPANGSNGRMAAAAHGAMPVPRS